MTLRCKGRAKARAQVVRALGECSITEIAVRLQCRLNRAEALLRRTAQFPEPEERTQVWLDIHDFLSAEHNGKS